MFKLRIKYTNGAMLTDKTSASYHDCLVRSHALCDEGMDEYDSFDRIEILDENGKVDSFINCGA